MSTTPYRYSHHFEELIRNTLQEWLIGSDGMIATTSITNNITVDTNSSLNNSTNTTLCDPILFNLGGFSREGNNGTINYGLCPDTYLSFALCLAFVIVYIITVIFSAIGVIYKRKSGHIVARDPTSLYMTLIAGFIFVVGLTMRIIVGRKIFPCGLITFSFFTLPPAIMLPITFRMLRVYLMYKINLLKMKLFEISTTTTTQTTTSPNNNNNNNTTNNTNNTNDSTTNTTNVANNTNATSTTNDNNNTNQQNDSTSTNQAGGGVVESQEDNNNSKMIMFGHEDRSSRQEQIHKVMNFDPSNIDDIEMYPLNEWEDSTTIDGDSQADVTTWNMSEIKDVSDVKKQVKQLAILNFFVSKKFILTTYLIAFLIGVFIWVVLGIVEEVTYNASTDPNKKRLFLFDGGLFVFDRGCGLTTTTVLVVGVHALFYILLEVVFLVLSIRSDRDTWGLKRETLLLILVQFCAAIIFIVVGMLEITEKLLDYLVPTGLALWIYEFVEIVLCVGLPAIYAIMSDRSANATTTSTNQSSTNNNSNNNNSGSVVVDIEKNQQPILKESSGIEKVLKNKKTYHIMLDFARRSYCTESVLCWRDIQRFKKARRNHRKKAATHILKAYLTVNSPLELNISKIEDRKMEIEKIIENEENSKISHNLFIEIQDHCLNDMTDLFERLKNSNKEIADFVLSTKSAQ